MEFSQILGAYFDRSSAMQTLWNFYVTIALALLAFFGSSTATHRKTVAVFITVAYVAFAIVNLDALVDATRQRRTLQKTATSKASTEEEKSIAKTLTPPRVASVIVFHVCGDVLTIAGVWYFVFKPVATSSSLL